MSDWNKWQSGVSDQVDRLQAALRESQARVEEYRREVERRDELLAGADADLRESQAREAVLIQAIERIGCGPEDDAPLTWKWLTDVTEDALASPSDAAAKLLERVANLEASEQVAVNRAGLALADRDRWLARAKELEAEVQALRGAR